MKVGCIVVGHGAEVRCLTDALTKVEIFCSHRNGMEIKVSKTLKTCTPTEIVFSCEEQQNKDGVRSYTH